MKIRSTVAILFLLALCCTVAAAFAQDKSKPASPPAMSPAEMEAMMKAAALGEPQKKLGRLVGDWTFTNTMWMVPGQPPVTSTGTMHGVALMGGRYVEHTWKGDMMGMPFEGRGTDGYDNIGKQYVASWLDNMGTGIIYSTGSCDDAGKVCTYKAEVWDAMTGKKTTSRSVITWMDDNNFKNEMYSSGPGGQETKAMEIVVKRK